MKKLIVRIAGSICILAALALAIFPAWVQVGGVDREDTRDLKKAMTRTKEDEDGEKGLLPQLKDFLIEAVDSDDETVREAAKEDLKNYDLPATKNAIKKRFDKHTETAELIFQDQFSAIDLINLSMNIPSFAEDTANMAEMLTADSEGDEVLDTIADITDGIKDADFVFIAIIAYLAIFVLLGVGAAVANAFGKLRALKYIFFILLLISVLVVCIGLPMATEALLAEIDLNGDPRIADVSIEDYISELTLTGTAVPYISALLALAPIILNIATKDKQNDKKKIESEA